MTHNKGHSSSTQEVYMRNWLSHFYFGQTNPEIVKRWSNEVQDAVQARAALVQFHALALLHQVCWLVALIYVQVLLRLWSRLVD
jgi:hypothetical protein